MRTKRFLSLLLAVAMLASLTISASATAETSKVYLAEDFTDASKYNSMNHLRVTAGYGYWDGDTFVHNTYDHDDDPETAEITIRNASKTSTFYWETKDGYYRTTTPAALRAAGTEHFLTFWNAGYTNTGISVGTNNNGQSALIVDPGAASANSSRWYRIFRENWTANEDEAYVISFDYEAIKTYKTDTYYGSTLFVNTSFIDSTGTATTHDAKTIMQTGPDENYDSGMEMHPSTNANYSSAKYHYEVELGKVYGFTTVFTADGDYLKRQSYLDGEAWGGSTTAGLTTVNTVEGIHIFLDGDDAWKLANVRAYTVSLADGAFNVARTAEGTVLKTTETMPVKFSQPVNDTTFDGDAVTITGTNFEGDITLVNGTDFTVSDVTNVVDGDEIYSTAIITFNTELENATDYTITFPETIANTVETTLAGYNTVEFSTPVPDIMLKGFDIVKGWGSDAKETVEAFTADSSLQTADLSVENTTDAAKNVAVIYAVYASNGQLTDVVYANDSVPAKTTKKIGAGLTLAAEGSVKAFIWDGISSLKPYSETTVKTIAAAAAE